jgi:hypothetical protein
MGWSNPYSFSKHPARPGILPGGEPASLSQVRFPHDLAVTVITTSVNSKSSKAERTVWDSEVTPARSERRSSVIQIDRSEVAKHEAVRPGRPPSSSLRLTVFTPCRLSQSEAITLAELPIRWALDRRNQTSHVGSGFGSDFTVTTPRRFGKCVGVGGVSSPCSGSPHCRKSPVEPEGSPAPARK